MRRLRAPLHLIVLLVLAAGAALHAAPPTADAFDATPAWPAAFTLRLKPADTATGDVLRLLTVEERTGEPRADELVRAPMFLHEDEPGDPADWALFAETDTARQHPLAFQLDDLRRNEAGRLTRCHLYFPVTLAAWERQRFMLVRRTAAVPPQPPALACQRDGDRVTLAGRDLAITFLAAGPRAGAITAMQVFGRALELPDGWIAPALTLVRQAPDCTIIRRTELTYAEPEDLEIRDVRYGSGPLFAKFTVRIGPRGLPDSAEFTYRIPAHGAVLIQTERLAPEGEPSAEVVGADAHRLLAGRLRLGPGRNAEVVRVPAGLRRLTRATQGHFLDALVDRPAGLGLLPVPYVQTGGGKVTLDGGTVAIAGASSFRRNTDGHSASLRAFWGELRFAFTTALDAESLWQLARRQFQPLVAVVDEPALGPADCLAFMPAIARRFREIPYWGRNWTQDAALLRLERNRPQYDALLARRPGASESNPSVHLPGWARATPPQPRNPKDQGRIDPYHLAYGSSVIPLLHRWAPHPRLPSVARAIGAASHQAFGRVNAAGFPRVDCFASALNMQLGPLGLALFGATETGDTALAAWARDALHAPGVTAIYGHGQRPYPGEIGRPDRRSRPVLRLRRCDRRPPASRGTRVRDAQLVSGELLPRAGPRPPLGGLVVQPARRAVRARRRPRPDRHHRGRLLARRSVPPQAGVVRIDVVHPRRPPARPGRPARAAPARPAAAGRPHGPPRARRQPPRLVRRGRSHRIQNLPRPGRRRPVDLAQLAVPRDARPAGDRHRVRRSRRARR